MPDPDFTLTANLYIPSEDSPSLDAVSVRAEINRKLPTAVVDFDRGRAHVEKRIAELQRLGAPEMICRGESANLERTISVDVPIPGFDSHLIGYTTGFCYHDGCISLACDPFDSTAMIRGALHVSKALGLDVELTTGDEHEVAILLVPGNVSPETLVSRRYADLVSVTGTTSIQNEFRTVVRRASRHWLATHPEQRTKQFWTEAISDGDSLDSCLMRRILSIGEPADAVAITFDRAFWHHCLSFSVAEWTALLNFSGHPGPLFNLDG